MVEMVRFRAPSLVQWLASRPKGAATFREAEIMKGLQRNDNRIRSLVYLNYDGSIRWHENTKFLGMSYVLDFFIKNKLKQIVIEQPADNRRIHRYQNEPQKPFRCQFHIKSRTPISLILPICASPSPHRYCPDPVA